MIINGGIVTYNPDIEKLQKNLSRIAKQVCKLVIVDNGSKNIEDIKRLVATFENASVVLNYENFGIARALNQIMKWSSNNGGDWTITLDQDSECSDCIIDLYKPYLNKEKVGMLTCRYTDRNLNEVNIAYNSDYKEIDFCITSASLLKNECWKKTAGFDEYLFIDKVDNDICLKLQNSGFKIICVNKIGFTHEVGKAKEISFFGKKCIVYNHSAFRRYFIARNTVYIARKYKKISFIHEFLHLLFYSLIILIYEDEKFEKLSSNIRGCVAGLFHPIKDIDYTKSRVNFFLPSILLSGGVRVVLKYAHLLSDKGYDVKIYVPIVSYMLKESSNKARISQIRNTLGKVYHLCLKRDFKSLEAGDCIIPAFKLKNKYIRDAEFAIATAWPTAYDVNSLKQIKGRKIYFVQDYEVWDSEVAAKKTYDMPLFKIVISNWINEKLKEQGSKTGVIVHNGLDCRKFYPDEAVPKKRGETETINCLMLYHKLKKKGVHYGVNAFESARKKVKNLSLELFGMETPVGMGDYVFHKSPNEEELRQLYNWADIFIFPSKNEGWGLTPVEAMACGCAVVGTNTGCMIDLGVNEKNALIVQPEDVEGLSKAIVKLAENPKLRNEIARNGLETARMLDWHNATELFEKCMWEALICYDT